MNTDNAIQLHRRCPVCQAQNGVLLKELHFSVENDSLLPSRYRVVACADCWFVFDDVEADAGVFSRYYHLASKYIGATTAGAGGETVSETARWAAIYRFLKPHLRQGARIADLGCGKGGLLKYLFQHGFCDLTGVDASADCLAELVSSYNIRGICGDLAETDIPGDFDLLIAAQVFEHLFDPGTVLARLAATAGPNTMLYLETPDAARYEAFPHAPFYYFDQEHINHFDQNSLGRLGARHGWQPIQAESFEVEVLPGFVNPVVGVLFRRQPDATGLASNRAASRAVERYIEQSAANGAMSFTADRNAPAFLWGIGAYAKNLLYAGCFDQLNLTGLIDADPTREGRKIGRHRIFLPEKLLDYNRSDAIVLITTVLYRDEVKRQLADWQWRGKIIDCTRNNHDRTQKTN